MIDFPYLSDLLRRNDAKILMLVIDGLGGIPDPVYGRSEMEAARMPNLDNLARNSAGGVVQFVAPGITVGSGPGHLSLFGYDPLKYFIGRGALEAMGVDLEMEAGDIAARGNFAIVDDQGVITDRRAGRIESEAAAQLVEKLDHIKLEGGEASVRHVEGYRFVVRLRGKGLSSDVTDTDPQQTGGPLPEAHGRSKVGEQTAELVRDFVSQARKVLDGSGPANAVLLRGWSGQPALPSFCDSYGLNSAAIAAYPMYRGLARLAGMKALATGGDFHAEIETLQAHWAEHNFFYLHYKDVDIAGESQGFRVKKRALEVLDESVPQILGLKPDVLLITGDHSTPSSMEGHSWHPVPLLIHSKWTQGDGIHRFNEREARQGSLGFVAAEHVMLLALAHAGKLLRFGA
ncbi:MAG: 2,3-bisphosphoglycerate-independent phosphoglycerate mutase [Dehalococcoidia bacterium]